MKRECATLFMIGLLQFCLSFNDSETICAYNVQWFPFLDSHCAGEIKITIMLPSGFWEAMKNLSYRKAIFEVAEVNNTYYKKIKEFSCSSKPLRNCSKIIDLPNPVAHGVRVFRIYFNPDGMHGGCSYIEKKRGCGMTPLYSLVVPYSNTSTLPPRKFNKNLNIIIIFSVIIFAVGLGILLIFIKRKQSRPPSTSIMDIALIGLSENSLNIATEPFVNTDLEILQQQLGNRFNLTIVDSQNAENNYRNDSDVDHLIDSNQAFIIVPSDRMVKEVVYPDEQVVVKILNFLQSRRDRCVFACLTNDKQTLQRIQDKYTHFRRIKVFMLYNPRNVNAFSNEKLNKLVRYLKEKMTHSNRLNNTVEP